MRRGRDASGGRNMKSGETIMKEGGGENKIKEDREKMEMRKKVIKRDERENLADIGRGGESDTSYTTGENY